jgi:hypothetical protein
MTTKLCPVCSATTGRDEVYETRGIGEPCDSCGRVYGLHDFLDL